MRLSLALAGVLAAPTLVGCALSAPPDPGPDGTSSSTTATAVVEVERSSGSSDGAHNDTVAARVVRVKQGAVDDSALAIAGVGPDVPAIGSCLVPSDASAALVQGRGIELLDIGQVSITSDADQTKSTVLTPRSMPDPAGVVSGFFYSARTADVFNAGSKVLLKSSGSADGVDPFTVSVNAPHDLSDVRVLLGADGLDVSWDATDADAHDVVYADVLAPRAVVRCVAGDAGHLLVPSNWLTADDGQIAVHRLHKESFRAKGIEPGEIRFDVSKVVGFHR